MNNQQTHLQRAKEEAREKAISMRMFADSPHPIDYNSYDTDDIEELLVETITSTYLQAVENCEVLILQVIKDLTKKGDSPADILSEIISILASPNNQ